jgi:hypothetical protein
VDYSTDEAPEVRFGFAAVGCGRWHRHGATRRRVVGCPRTARPALAHAWAAGARAQVTVFQAQAAQLAAALPALFAADCPVRLMTENGRSLLAKSGFTASRRGARARASRGAVNAGVGTLIPRTRSPRDCSQTLGRHAVVRPVPQSRLAPNRAPHIPPLHHTHTHTQG